MNQALLLLFTMRLSMFFADKNPIFPVALFLKQNTEYTIAVAMARRSHLFSYRTQKLSSSARKVLGRTRPGRLRRCRIHFKKAGLNEFQICFFICQKKPLVKRLFILFGYFDCFLQIGFEVVGDFAVALDLNKRKTHVHKVFVPVAEQKCGVCQAPLW